ncbi:hypothetical protein AB0F52_32110 [Amycolatopsis sp. NPDC024027]|uniref:hypothetical protein n=1 Tax=Amycolatopsis sp. NPDC024027 TaxID=3154327 RepID=UPI0033F7510C
MARRPEVFARSLEPEEAQRLVKITRSTRDRMRLRRSGIVRASAQGRSAGEIAVMFAATEGYVREAIHAFNESRVRGVVPKGAAADRLSSGRPPGIRSAASPPANRLSWACRSDGSDYPDHDAQEPAIAGYLRWRNRHPKRRFAVNSKLRRPDYLPNVV